MPASRDNCIILMVEAPVPERVDPKLAEAFGPERAVHIHLDLLQNVYRLVKGFGNALPILAYSKAPHHPDLTWLDTDDPGFLDTKGRPKEEKVQNVFRLAFNTGSKKALLLNHLSPGIRTEWIQQAFDAITEKTVVLGPNKNGSAYLAGFTVSAQKLIEGCPLESKNAAEEISDRARKAKLSVYMLPEAVSVESEETLRAWLETKDPVPTLFRKETAPEPSPERKRHQDEARHGKRGARHAPPPQPSLPDTQEPRP